MEPVPSSERGQGFMRQLIQKAFEVMESRKVALTVIIPADPWLFDYYRDLGYTEAFDYSEETYIRPIETAWEQGILVVPPEVPSMESLYNFFNKKQRERTCYVLHGYDDFVTILRDLQMSGGQMLTALNIQNEPIGMIFFHPAGDHIYVKELMYDNDNIKNLLLQEATIQNKVERLYYRTPFAGPGTFPLGMARVLDRDRLIHHWASTHENSVLNIGELKEIGHSISYPPVTRLPEPGSLYELDARLGIHSATKQKLFTIPAELRRSEGMVI